MSLAEDLPVYKATDGSEHFSEVIKMTLLK